MHLENERTKSCNLQAAVDDLTVRLSNCHALTARLEKENALQKHRIEVLVQEVQGLKADKVGLETTLQSKNATIDDLGINLNNTQLEHQRMAMVANNLALTDPLRHGAYAGVGMGTAGLYASGISGGGFVNGLGYGGSVTSPNRFLARSLVTKKFM